MHPLVVAVLFLLAPLGFAAASTDAPSQPRWREIHLAEGAFARGDPIPRWVDPVALPPPLRGAPLHVRLADDHYLFGDTPVVFFSRALHVNDASALSDIGHLQIDFVPEYHRVKLHTLRVWRGGRAIDTTQSAGVRFLQRETGLERGIYTGVASAVLVVDDLRVGDTLHFEYSIEGDNPVFGGRHSGFASWDHTVPVALRRITFNHPRGRPLFWKMLGEAALAPPQVETSETGALHRVRLVGRDLHAVQTEPQLPEGYQALRTIQFSEYRSWNEVARWAEELFTAPHEFTPEAVAFAERLRALPSREARISAALRWVQSEIRYFAVSLGESSHRPHPPALVLARRYGDCKDKSLLLIALLRAAGIEARPALVSAGARTGPKQMLPTPMAFDHAIVALDEGRRRFYLDPTRMGQGGRLERMGQPLEGALVLVVARDSDGLSRIETPNIGELVRTEVEERIRLAQLGGEGTIEIRKTYNGTQAEAIRIALPKLSAFQLRGFALRGFEHRYPDASVLGEPLVQDDPESNRLVVVTTFTASKVSLPASQRWLVPFTAANFRGAFPLPDGLRRIHPLGVPTHPYEARYRLEVVFPQNVSAMRDPFTERVENPHFSFVARGSFRGNRADYEFALRTRSAEVQAASLQGAAGDIRKVNNLMLGSLVLARSEVQEVIRFGPRALAERIRERLLDTLERTSQTIASARLSGEDLAEARCARAQVLAELSRGAEAIVEANEATQAAPSYPNALACRANVFWTVGQFELAAADYSRALALGHHPFQTFYRRGQARFYLGRLEEAAGDFAKAAASGENDKRHAELWLAWTLRRLGQALPPEVVERAKAEARGPWPRPALAMLVGALPPEEVLKEVERLKGDERAMTLAEAWFYVGQNDLLENRPEAARAAFAKARAQGVLGYIEHVAAGFELQRLEAATPDPFLPQTATR